MISKNTINDSWNSFSIKTILPIMAVVINLMNNWIETIQKFTFSVVPYQRNIESDIFAYCRIYVKTLKWLWERRLVGLPELQNLHDQILALHFCWCQHKFKNTAKDSLLDISRLLKWLTTSNFLLISFSKCFFCKNEIFSW